MRVMVNVLRLGLGYVLLFREVVVEQFEFAVLGIGWG
jgi:hypothetical protein